VAEGAHILPNLPKVTAGARREALPYEPVCAIFRRYLHGQKLKFTPERAMILDAVLRKTGLFEAEQLVRDVRQLGHPVSRATAYRTLSHLQDAGILKQVFFDNKQSYYEVIAGRQAYDYLICVASGRVIEFSSEKLRRLRDEICREHGFEPLSHQFHVFGLSPEGKAGKDAAEGSVIVSDVEGGGGRAEAACPVAALPTAHQVPGTAMAGQTGSAEGGEGRQGENGEPELRLPET
jgi:Fur family ferric uptake transcriptional regulator